MVDSGIPLPRYSPSAVRDFAHVFTHGEVMQIQFKAHTNRYGSTFQWKEWDFSSLTIYYRPGPKSMCYPPDMKASLREAIWAPPNKWAEKSLFKKNSDKRTGQKGSNCLLQQFSSSLSGRDSRCGSNLAQQCMPKSTILAVDLRPQITRLEMDHRV